MANVVTHVIAVAKKFKLVNTIVKLGKGVLLAEALEGILADFIVEIGNGFIKLKGGILIQWGTYSGRVNSQIPWGPYQYYTVPSPNFPIPFKASSPTVIQTPKGSHQLWITGDYQTSTSTKIGEPRVFYPEIGRTDTLSYSYLAIGTY